MVPTAKIISDKKVRVWVSMVSCFKKLIKMEILKRKCNIYQLNNVHFHTYYNKIVPNFQLVRFQNILCNC